MNQLLILLSALTLSSVAYSYGTIDSPKKESNNWVKVFSYAVEATESSQFTHYLTPDSAKLDIYASTDSSNKTVLATRTVVSDHTIESGSDSREILKVSRAKYLNILDLASRLSTDWGSPMYEKTKQCDTVNTIKYIYFNGKSQSIISKCGRIDPNNTITTNMQRLSVRLQAILKNAEVDDITTINFTD